MAEWCGIFEIEKCSIQVRSVRSVCDVSLMTPLVGSRISIPNLTKLIALLTNPKPKLMVFRSLDVSRKYTCFMYVFLSTEKKFRYEHFRPRKKLSQLGFDHFYHRSVEPWPHTAGNRWPKIGQEVVITVYCECSSINTLKNHKWRMKLTVPYSNVFRGWISRIERRYVKIIKLISHCCGQSEAFWSKIRVYIRVYSKQRSHFKYFG